MVEIPLRVETTARTAAQRIRRLEKGLEKTKKATTEEIGRLVRDKIKLYMPKRTGESADSIGVVKRINTKGYSEIRVGLLFNPHPEKRWKGQYFNLPAWMFTSKRAYKHFRTGNISKMRSVVPEARKRFRRRIVNDIKELVR